MLFSSYFLITYLIYITVYVLIRTLNFSHSFLKVGGSAEATGSPGSLWDTLPATCSQVPSPRTLQPLVPKPVRLQECDISLGHYGRGGIGSMWVFCFLPYTLNRGELWSRGAFCFSFQWTASWFSGDRSFLSKSGRLCLLGKGLHLYP